MRSALVAVLVVVAAPAWAVGERVLVTTAAEPLKETLCVSMNCVSAGGRDAIVSARPVKGGLEVTVKSPNGDVKLVHVIPSGDEGDLSSIDLVRASSLVVKAIESPQRAAPRPQKLARKPGRPALFARR